MHRASERTRGVRRWRHLTVANRDRLIEMRRGYEPSPKDVHDLEVLWVHERERVR